MNKQKLFKRKGPELLISLADHVAMNAKSVLGITDVAAEALGQQVALEMAQVWGGQILYMPSGYQLKTAQIHSKIWEAFNGTNQNELAKEYGLSVQHIYKIVKEMRKITLKETQPDLFDDSSENEEA